MMCENCKNAKLCKYKEQIEKFTEKNCVAETLDTKPECLELTWKCKYFEEDKPEVKEVIPDCIDKFDFGKWLKAWKDYEPMITKVSSNPCADCNWYKNYIATGEVRNGASHCQWCSNSPFKVTCSSSTETRPEDVQTVATKTVSCSSEPGGMDYNSPTDEEVRKYRNGK